MSYKVYVITNLTSAVTFFAGFLLQTVPKLPHYAIFSIIPACLALYSYLRPFEYIVNDFGAVLVIFICKL